MAIESLNNHLILALFIFNTAFLDLYSPAFYFLGETIFALWRQKNRKFLDKKNSVHSKKIAKLLKLQNWKGKRKKKTPRYIARKKKKRKEKGMQVRLHERPPRALHCNSKSNSTHLFSAAICRARTVSSFCRRFVSVCLDFLLSSLVFRFPKLPL
jgi:hypothetical protein